MNNTEISKFLSYVLRHKPESIGLVLDKEGWCYITDLIPLANSAGHKFDMSQLWDVVDTSDKKRFTISEDGMLIRAAQGHSTDSVNIKFKEKAPPAVLYHGTAEKNLASIKKFGLRPGNRHHVHLSADIGTAKVVGARHGKVIVLMIDTVMMRDRGYKFFQSDNGVWLVDDVSYNFISQIISI